MPNEPELFISAAREPAATRTMVVGANLRLRFGKENGINDGVCGGYLGVNLCKCW